MFAHAGMNLFQWYRWSGKFQPPWTGTGHAWPVTLSFIILFFFVTLLLQWNHRSFVIDQLFWSVTNIPFNHVEVVQSNNYTLGYKTTYISWM